MNIAKQPYNGIVQHISAHIFCTRPMMCIIGQKSFGIYVRLFISIFYEREQTYYCPNPTAKLFFLRDIGVVN